MNGTLGDYSIVCERCKLYEWWIDGAGVMTFLSLPFHFANASSLWLICHHSHVCFPSAS